MKNSNVFVAVVGLTTISALIVYNYAMRSQKQVVATAPKAVTAENQIMAGLQRNLDMKKKQGYSS